MALLRLVSKSDLEQHDHSLALRLHSKLVESRGSEVMEWEGRLPLSSNRAGPFVSALTHVVLQLGQKPVPCMLPCVVSAEPLVR